MATTDDDLKNMIADAERAHAQADAAPKDDFSSLLDQALSAKDAAPLPPASRGTYGDGKAVDQTPLPDPTGTIDPRFGEHPTEFANGPLAPDPEELKATRAGVAIDNPAPVGHFRASFAANDEERVKAYEKDLKQEFGPDTRVEIGPITGKVEWLDPKTGKFSLADPPRSGYGEKIKGAAGGSLVATLELAGNALGAATGSPVMVAAGGGAGAYIGELVRLRVGQTLGINQDMTDSELESHAKEVGMISGGLGLAANAVTGFAQYVKHAIAGEAVSFAKKFGEKLGITMEGAAKDQDVINQTIQAERLRMVNAGEKPDVGEHSAELTIGEASGNKDQLSLEEYYKRSPEYQAEFGAWDEDRQKALKDFYTVISKPFERGAITPSQMATKVRLASTRALNTAERRVTEHQARYEAQAADAIESVETMPLRSLGEVARGVGDVETKAFTDRAEQLASNIKTLAGDAPIIENRNTAGVFNTLDEKARNIVIPGLQKQTQSSQMLPGGSPSDVAANPDTTLGKLYDGNTKWTFGQSWATLSRLKQVVRDGSLTDIDKGALKKVIGAMEQDLYDSTTSTELGTAYRSFTDWYRTEKKRLNSGLVDKILDKDGPVKDAGDIFRQVFPETGTRAAGGVGATAEFMDLIKHDPQAIGSFRKAIADDWRQYSVQDGRVNPARSAQWFRLHEDQLKLEFQGLNAKVRPALSDLSTMEGSRGEALFTPKEIGEIQKANSFEGVLAKREEVSKSALDKINSDIRGTLSDLDNPGQLVQLIKSDYDGITATKVLRNLGKLPAVKQGIQAAYLQDMRALVLNERQAGSTELKFNAKALRQFIYGKGEDSKRGQEKVIEALFGSDYLEGLKTLERTVARANLGAVAPNRSGTSFWEKPAMKVASLFSRAYFGPLSKELTRVNVAKKGLQMAADAATARAILSPANMKALMGVWQKDVRDRKAMVVLTQLGFGPADLSPDVGKDRSNARALSELRVGR